MAKKISVIGGSGFVGTNLCRQLSLKQQDFEIITVNVGESSLEISHFKKHVKFDLPILLDVEGKAVQDWGVYAYPSNFILDKNAIIRYTYRGALEWDSPVIIKTIEKLF